MVMLIVLLIGIGVETPLGLDLLLMVLSIGMILVGG